MNVIDASVVIKWFIEEVDSPAALSFKDAHIRRETLLLAPDLLLCEVTNVLVLSNLFSTTEVQECLRNLFDLEIDLISPSPDLMSSAIELASSRKITVYDAFYLAIAKEFDIKLITADKKLFSKAKDLHCIQLL